jgi:phosphoglycolate phosphatase-like HAD superfamily hydrolase
VDSRPRLVLFDVEGTLVERDPLLAPAWAAAAKTLGMPIDAADLSGIGAMTDRAVAEAIAGRGTAADALLAARDAAMEGMVETGLDHWRLAPAPGAASILGRLASDGIILGVATRGSRRAVLSELGRAGLPPDLFCVWSSGERADLFEWVVQDAIDLISANPASTIVVGSDISAAEAAAVCGARSLIVAGGRRRLAWRPGADADWVAVSIDESDPATAAAFGITPARSSLGAPIG